MTSHRPDVAILRTILRYDPDTGKLYWRLRPATLFQSDLRIAAWNARFAGSEAFTANDGKGYRVGNIFNKKHKAHRVVWAMETGAWPSHQIDHVNGNKTDNRLKNLREATNAENSRNRGANSNNRSGAKGVSWSKQKSKWVATIWTNGKLKTLGHFHDVEEAAAAYAKGSTAIHGSFGRSS